MGKSIAALAPDPHPELAFPARRTMLRQAPHQTQMPRMRFDPADHRLDVAKGLLGPRATRAQRVRGNVPDHAREAALDQARNVCMSEERRSARTRVVAPG